MAEARSKRRFQATVQFLSANRYFEEATATVLLRDREMVIDIGAPSRYLVRGKRVGDYFAGANELEGTKPPSVKARWALLGDVCVGIWIEEGVEYLFSFMLPQGSSDA